MQLSTVYKERLKAAYEKGLQQAFQQYIMTERQSAIACILRIRVWSKTVGTGRSSRGAGRSIRIGYLSFYVTICRPNASPLQGYATAGRAHKRSTGFDHTLRIRFGEIDSQLEAIIPEIITLSPAEYIQIALKLSREELLARFSGS